MDSLPNDKTQALLNRMAQQRIEASIANAIKLDVAQQKAETLNRAGATVTSRYRYALKQGVSRVAIFNATVH